MADYLMVPCIHLSDGDTSHYAKRHVIKSLFVLLS